MKYKVLQNLMTPKGHHVKDEEIKASDLEFDGVDIDYLIENGVIAESGSFSEPKTEVKPDVKTDAKK